ncbi:3-dehydroquinate synthase family protein [Geothrix sp. 21YS21S-4]|uniref:3-dehydroquinate synthase n=1 Tax=Geothrix sp. 21YS21S-4 TaxID=3068889 RepID=UPI0027BACD4C|nr:3-dehydroquinate synthase family protein [Geothrix sp. 21YS21S-4]
MRLATPPGFATEVFLLEAPDPSLLPEGPWTLVGDQRLREAWIEGGLPEPSDALWISVSEEEKKLRTVIPWLEHWARIPLHRDATVVALGGGVLSDLAGLAAALYLRGIAWQVWPTTLLGMVDAALGGKTGADLAAGKNLVGAFHAPKRLVACTGFLRTLPERHMENGRWELVKTAILQGELGWATEILQTGPVRTGWIERALAYKAGVVHRDPREAGERRLLNLGHTLGHALEAASGYQLLHGEAVGLGLLASCLLGEEQGLKPFPAELLDALARRLAPLAPLVAPWQACLPLLHRDKKARHAPGHTEDAPVTEIHCILPRPGESAIQRVLAPRVWEAPHARLVDLLDREATRA